MDRTEARRSLDRRLDAFRGITEDATPPKGGWVKTIRKALGMTAADLGARLGVTGPAVSKLEASEDRGTVGLDTLRRAADALDCDVVYTLVPRHSLEATVARRAAEAAATHVTAVHNTMALEDQAPHRFDAYVRAAEIARDLDRRTPAGLWSADLSRSIAARAIPEINLSAASALAQFGATRTATSAAWASLVSETTKLLLDSVQMPRADLTRIGELIAAQTRLDDVALAPILDALRNAVNLRAAVPEGLAARNSALVADIVRQAVPADYTAGERTDA